MAIDAEDKRSVTLQIRDPLRHYPWQRRLNPHYSVCKNESEAWFRQFNVFSPKVEKAFIDCDFCLLGSLAFPLLDHEGCRIGCDLMCLFFFLDDCTDVSDTQTAQFQAGIVMDAFRNPHTPRAEDEWVGGKVAREFWLNYIKYSTESSQLQFLKTFKEYLDAVVQQAADRSQHYIRDIDSYFPVRRNTIGAKPCFAVVALHMNLPDSVLEHPVIAKMTELALDMIIISNDLLSYKKEYDCGDDGHNFVTIVMQQHRLAIQEAVDFVSDLHDDRVSECMELWQQVPTFVGPLDLDVRTYCHGLCNWVRANDAWSCETIRYLGKHSEEFRRTRQVELQLRCTVV